jgi:hypothetical protein
VVSETVQRPDIILVCHSRWDTVYDVNILPPVKCSVGAWPFPRLSKATASYCQWNTIQGVDLSNFASFTMALVLVFHQLCPVWASAASSFILNTQYIASGSHWFTSISCQVMSLQHWIVSLAAHYWPREDLAYCWTTSVILNCTSTVSVTVSSYSLWAVFVSLISCFSSFWKAHIPFFTSSWLIHTYYLSSSWLVWMYF